MATGRPSIFSDEVSDMICDLLVEGKSLRSICLLDEMPNVSTVIKWLKRGEDGEEPYATFLAHYVRARDMQTEAFFDEIVHIADDDSEDRVFNDDGKLVMNSEFIQRSRVKIDARKWVLGKMKPQKYGDKTVHSNDPENPMTVTGINVNFGKADGD